MYHPTRGGVRGGRDRKLSLSLSLWRSLNCFKGFVALKFSYIFSSRIIRYPM
jgi:hypothetical protein